jgi:DNA-directed RNA polymerase subunit RPC12/RpoP
MHEDNILEFLLICKECGAEYLVDMPVDEIDLDGELAPMECEDCGNEIDANDALKQAVINSKK